MEGFPGWLPLAALLPAGLVLAWAARRLPLYKLEGDPEALRVLLVGAAMLAGMRWFNTSAMQGVTLHFLGATIATLMFGGRFACWVMALVSLSGLALHAAWLGWATDFLVTGAVPIAITLAVSRAAKRWVAPNIFTYIFVNAFVAGALAMGASTLLKALAAGFWQTGSADAYLMATPLLMYGEAFFSGTTLAMIVVYRPQWCATFDDETYLHKP